MEPFWIFTIVVGVAVLIIAWAGIIRVSEGTVKVVERFGKYHRCLQPGINFILPGIDSIHRGRAIYTYIDDGKSKQSLIERAGAISTREEILDPGEFDTIASDNAVVHPDTICYFRIVDPRKAVYGVGNLGEAMVKLLETTLRQEIGKLDSDALIGSRDVVGAKVQTALERASEAWGTKILRVEIQEIRFSVHVQENLTRAREAELSRRARVIAAQQERDTEILRAEGQKKSAIMIAEGDYEAARLRADSDFLLASRRLEGEAKGTEALAKAVRENPEAIVALKALETQASVAESLGKSSSAMVVPLELAGLTGTISSIGHAIRMLSNSDVGGEAPSDVEPQPRRVAVTKPADFLEAPFEEAPTEDQPDS